MEDASDLPGDRPCRTWQGIGRLRLLIGGKWGVIRGVSAEEQHELTRTLTRSFWLNGESCFIINIVKALL